LGRRTQVLDVHLAKDAEGRAIRCNLQPTRQFWIFLLQTMAQFNQLHGKVVSNRIDIELEEQVYRR
jgi:hypothetical protein